MRTADFQYDLPPELIAQHPAPRRDDSRLLVLHRPAGRVEHRRFPDFLAYLRPGDLLVLNNSRVLPARLRGRKPLSGGEVEVLLVAEQATNEWWALLRPGKRVRAGSRIEFVPPPGGRGPGTKDQGPGTRDRQGVSGLSGSRLAAVVLEKNREGHYRLQFEGGTDVRERLDEFGEVPLPPYIQRRGAPSAADRDRYQTVFAQPPGSVAAPTAGLHFTEDLLRRTRALGVQLAFVTLHVGLGTFAPVKTAHVADHVMHEEAFEVPAETAAAVGAARREGRRVIAVGTTSVRVLESPLFRGTLPARPEPVAPVSPPTPAGSVRGRTRLFIRPPHRFQVVDGLLTNFHLPASTLLMLVCAFAAPGETRGRQVVLAAYAEAVRERYRFFSYGDAMLIL